MKHSQPVASPLLTEDDLLQLLRARLDCTPAGKAALAADLGVSVWLLSRMLRRQSPIDAGVAAQLGCRPVVMFEPLG